MIIGIDPGQSGGIAFVTDLVAVVYKMPDTERDLWEVLNSGLDAQKAFIEKVGPMPKQGVVSMFKFGKHYGMLRGMLIAMGVPFDDVTPQRWQKALGCMTKGDKNVSKAKAQELFPGIKMTHAKADALLIAEYGRRLELRG